jgi:hypothetical protein
LRDLFERAFHNMHALGCHAKGDDRHAQAVLEGIEAAHLYAGRDGFPGVASLRSPLVRSKDNSEDE